MSSKMTRIGKSSVVLHFIILLFEARQRTEINGPALVAKATLFFGGAGLKGQKPQANPLLSHLFRGINRLL